MFDSVIRALQLMMQREYANEHARLSQHEKYYDFANLMNQTDYLWEAYEVKTEDGWDLSMFRITNKTNDGSPQWNDNPVLIQHGMVNDAQTWVQAGLSKNSITWALQLADYGYDVWMPNNRGTRYSNTNDRDGEWSEQERWDFSFAEMGLYDQPAFIEKILAETGQDKLTYIGHSQGTTQMLYAMAEDADYYADRLHRFIGVAPVYEYDLLPREDYDSLDEWKQESLDLYDDLFTGLQMLGIYSLGGAGETAKHSMICLVLGDRACDVYAYLDDPSMTQSPIQTQMYYHQNAIQGRFQEYVDFEDYVSDPSKQDSQLVDLSAIQSIPVTLVASRDDEVVSVEQAERIFSEIGDTQKHMWFVDGWTHSDFTGGKDDDVFVAQIDQTIKYGTLID